MFFIKHQIPHGDINADRDLFAVCAVTDDHTPLYLLKHKARGVVLEVMRPVTKLSSFGQKCQLAYRPLYVLHQLGYPSISVTNVMTKTVKDLGKRILHTMHLFTGISPMISTSMKSTIMEMVQANSVLGYMELRLKER